MSDENPVLGLFENQSAAVLTDAQGRITSLNALANSLLGPLAQSYIGKQLSELLQGVTLQNQLTLVNQHLAAIIESSDDIIISKDLNGIINSWNKGAEKVLGYTADEVIGRPVSMLMPPESQEDTKFILNKIRRGEKVDHYLARRRRKDGKIVDISLTVSPIRNAAGEIIGASKVGRDVTEVRRADMLKEHLAAIVESSEDIIVSKTLDGIITSWNRGAERILGYSASDVIGQPISMLMPMDHKEDTQRILGQIRQGKKVEHYETQRIHKNGQLIDVSLTVSPIRNAEGKVIGASKIGRDITHQKLLEKERQEAEQRKDEFLAMLAHELRNPVASISNATQLFGRLETEQELEWAKDVVQRQVKHLSRLIDDLLDVSRITRGKISLRKEPVNLAPIINSAVEMVRPLLEERKHQIVVSLSSGTLQLEADPLRLEQILVNLLTNAAKYTEASGQITLSANSDNEQIQIKISDTGMGIPSEFLPKIFDLFVQGDRTIARSEGGLGIGLTLVHKLTEMHGGSITAASEGVGKGSIFTVRLPTLVSARADAKGSSDKLPAIRHSSRILVVDDNIDTANALAKFLKLLGHDVALAYDGDTAIDVAREHLPDIVLLDIGLPRRDGYEVVRQLRQEACCKKALIIAISGYNQEEDRRKSREAGFDHHLVKPVDFSALLPLL